MIGAGSGIDTRGDHTISAFERDILADGWIDCTALTVDGAVTLTDLYSNNANNCRTIAIPAVGATPARTIYLSNKQRIGVFDDLRTSSCPSDEGLSTTGLLPTVWQPRRFAVIAADNTLALSTQANNYDGDMYGPGTTTQLTPWTRPNISGYSTYPAGFMMQAGNWQAIDNIRFSGGPNAEMAFDYIADFRQNPTIREDAWIADETSGFTFPNDFIVTNASTLNVNTTLGFSSLMRVDAGSEVLLDTGADVTVNGGGQMTIFGTLINNGSITVNGNMNYETDDVIDTGPVFTVGSGADVDFQSDASITLEPGFHAQPGSRFHAFVNTGPKNGRIALGSEERIGESVAEQTARDGDMQPRLDEANLQHALHKAAGAVPTAFSLSQNYPNPFNPTTTISYALKEHNACDPEGL